MSKDNFYLQAIKALALITVYLVAARFSYGVVPLVLALFGCAAAISGKSGRAVSIYMLIPFTININPILLPKTGPVWPIALRFGTLALAMSLCMSAAKRKGPNRLPLGGMLPFLAAACIGSATGWLPLVSYMKLINYFVFFLGIWIGTQNLQEQPMELRHIRVTLFAIAAFIVLGSVAVIPFPAISYATSLQGAMAEGGEAAAVAAYKDLVQDGGKTLFCGILNHSQALAPILALSFSWLLCDMLFVEQRVRHGHVLLIVLALPMLYMTRSRVAFVTLIASLVIVYLYSIRKIGVDYRVKRKISFAMFAFSLVVCLVLVALEVKDNTVSKWVRKTQDVELDAQRHTLQEAMTASRQSLLEYSMYEFRRSPWFGSGFQVAEYNIAEVKGQALVLSASIEKGVLPVMVLGETGIVGSFLFALFLLTFYLSASTKRLYVTITMFTLLLVTNMGEASFFSPGGIGSVLWILSVCGGFVVDTHLLYGCRYAMWGGVPCNEPFLRG